MNPTDQMLLKEINEIGLENLVQFSDGDDDSDKDIFGLLLVDLQGAFADKVPHYDEIIKRTCLSVEVANLLEIPIAVTEQNPEKLQPTDPRVLELLPHQENLFSKMAFSAMDSKEVQYWLNKHQINHLIICGLETSICVYQTIIHADDEGYFVTLLRDCIGGRRPEDSQSVLAHLLHTYEDISILPAETFFYELIGSAKHPNFKEFINIIKQYN